MVLNHTTKKTYIHHASLKHFTVRNFRKYYLEVPINWLNNKINLIDTWLGFPRKQFWNYVSYQDIMKEIFKKFPPTDSVTEFDGLNEKFKHC